MFRPFPFECRDFSLIENNGNLLMLYISTENEVGGQDVYRLASSRNGVDWKDEGVVMRPSDSGWDDKDLWAMGLTGSTNNFTLYYSAIGREEGRHGQAIGVAYSKDLKTWERSVHNPILKLEEDNPYYSAEIDRANQRQEERPILFRDPFPFVYQGKEYLLFSAKDKCFKDRNACIGLAVKTGHTWEFLPPLYSPGLYKVLECPALYFIKGKTLLLFCVDLERTIHYAISEIPWGDFSEPTGEALLPRSNYVGRIVELNGERHLYSNIESNGKWYLDAPKKFQFIDSRIVFP